MARLRLRPCLDHGHFGLVRRVGNVERRWSPVAICLVLVRESNAKVSDGSQPPSAPASPLGVPAGSRSLDRLVRVPESWATDNAPERCRPVASHLGMARALNWSYRQA